MKKIVLAAAFATAASTAFAGNMEEPMMEMEPEMIVEETTGSSAGGIILPLMAILLLAAAASS
ncbi:hypothetical protein [Algirhabdus cladophorae]|uniref:hypothetical protein n=1 Tax=Algirhabdus cladophorae TaxID=3377108 RepID=UPI003B84558C